MLSANRLSDCQIPSRRSGEHGGGRVRVLLEQLEQAARESGPRERRVGTLDLLKWDITTGVNCDNSTPPQFEEWMLEGFSLPLPIDSDDYGATAGDTHTYVCRGQGHFGEALDRDLIEARDLGDPLYFPVNRPSTQVDSNGNVCTPEMFASTNCAVDKYDIIGFARLFIVDVWGGGNEKDEVVEFCGHFAGIEEDANARCMIARWESYTPEGPRPAGRGELRPRPGEARRLTGAPGRPPGGMHTHPHEKDRSRWLSRSRSSSCPRARTGRRTTASASARSSSTAGTASCSRPRRRGRAGWSRWASRRTSSTSRRRARASRTPGSSGPTSSPRRPRSSASRRSSSSTRSSAPSGPP